MKPDCQFFIRVRVVKKKGCNCKKDNNNLVEINLVRCRKYGEVTENTCMVCKGFLRKQQ